MSKFTLTIELGNFAMRSNGDVAKALSNVAKSVDAEHKRVNVGYSGRIRDINGNTVGKWEVVNDD